MRVFSKLFIALLFFWVSACNEIKEIPAPTTTLDAPVATDASNITETSFQANWNEVSGVANYLLEVATDEAFTSFVTGYENKIVSALFDEVSGLTANTTYYYRLRAVSTSGSSEYSNVIMLTTSDAGTPTLDAPVATDATSISQTGFIANWNPVTGATSYLLDVATDNSFANFVSGYNAKEVTGTSDNVTGLAAGTDYFYRVRAKNAISTSVNSNVISVTTDAVATFTVTSTDFAEGGTIATMHGGYVGQNFLPELTWSNPPAGTQSYAVVVRDLTFNGATLSAGDWHHGLVYNIPTSTTNFPQQAFGVMNVPPPLYIVGVGNFPAGITIEPYLGPTPLTGTTHEYEYIVYALDGDLPSGLADRGNFINALNSSGVNILGTTRITGFYTGL